MVSLPIYCQIQDILPSSILARGNSSDKFKGIQIQIHSQPYLFYVVLKRTWQVATCFCKRQFLTFYILKYCPVRSFVSLMYLRGGPKIWRLDSPTPIKV